jgi:hypothetical protein
VITCGQRIIPVEVKAGKTGNLRSLHQFTIEKDVHFAVKISSERPSLVKASGRMPDGRAYESLILNLPFYLVEKLDSTNADFLPSSPSSANAEGLQNGSR